MVKSYKDGVATARIHIRRDGTATLRIIGPGWWHKSEHKNEKAAYAAWRRWCR